jgi:hypothetical protein
MKKRNFVTKKMATIGFFCLWMLSSNLAFADKFERQVGQQLLNAAKTFDEMNNYKQTHDPHVGKIYTRRNTKPKILTLILEPGMSYAILGVCDDDCRNIDLDLYNESGRLIDSDHQFDDKPLVKVSPNRTAVFQLKITIPSCATHRCTYGIGVFGKVNY